MTASLCAKVKVTYFWAARHSVIVEGSTEVDDGLDGAAFVRGVFERDRGSPGLGTPR